MGLLEKVLLGEQNSFGEILNQHQSIITKTILFYTVHLVYSNKHNHTWNQLTLENGLVTTCFSHGLSQ